MNKLLIFSALLVLNMSSIASDSKKEPLLSEYNGLRIDTNNFMRDGKKCTAMYYYSGLPELPESRIINRKPTLNGKVVSEKEYRAVLAIRELRSAIEQVEQTKGLAHGHTAALEQRRLALNKVASGMRIDTPSCCCMQ